MALPNAISYPIPTEPLPAPRVDWTLDAGRAALLVHDMQRYFVRPFAEDCPALRTSVEHQASLIAQARASRMPVVFSVQPGGQAPAVRGLLQDRWGPGIGATPEDTEIIDALSPRDDDLVVTKHRYSLFAQTDVDEWLRARGRDQLAITGIYGHIGITATAFDAFMRDIQPFVVSDAIVDFSRDDHARTLDHLARTCAVVMDAKTTLRALDPPLSPWQEWLAVTLGSLLNDPEAGRSLVADPAQDVFAAGLDSIRTFSLLDDLADYGVELDFSDFVTIGTTGWLLREIDRSGVGSP